MRQVAPHEWGVRIVAGGFDYDIEWHRIDSHQKLVGWILHLTEKTWWKKEHSVGLILVTQDHFGWPAGGIR